MSTMAYYIWAVLLVLGNGLAVLSNLFTLPGNWILLALTALFAFLIPAEAARGIGWTTVFVLLGLAVLGELIEFFAGAAGAAKRGASRRAVLLAVVGGMAGSIAGATIGLGIPVIGSLIAAVGGGAFGAFLGAFLGEVWAGRTSQESLESGKAALIGRLLGTLGKTAVGAVMFGVATVDVFFWGVGPK